MQASPLKEVLLFSAGVTAITLALTQLSGVPLLSEYVHLAVGALFLLTAVRLAQREPGGLVRHGLDLGGLMQPADERLPSGWFGLLDLGRALRAAAPSALRESLAALAVAALIFPLFALGFYLWHANGRSFVWNPPEDLLSFALAQGLVVALPEEAYFRGWVQTRLADHWPVTRRILGADLSIPAWLLQALLFALIHFAVVPDPSRLAVFFPGLLFGWLRARRGGVGAGIALHAASNVLSELLWRGWQV